MSLLPGWSERIERVAAGRPAASPAIVIPPNAAYFAGRTTFVATKTEAVTMAGLAHARPIAWGGIDTEYRYLRPGIVVGDETRYDPRSVRPLLLSLALAEPTTGMLYQFVVDLRRPEVLDGLRAVLRLPFPFVGHHLPAELSCFWQLGLEEPRTLWDTLVAEKALHLGRHHKKYRVRPDADDIERVVGESEAVRERERFLGLSSTCRRHGLEHRFEQDKDRLARSFLVHADDQPFSGEQIDYAAEDARVAAQLYPRQLQAAASGGLVDHLVRIEMPWVVTNAEMTWRGVRVDAEAAGRVPEAAGRHLDELRPRLAGAGVANAGSHLQLASYFAKEGILDLFRRGRGHSFDKGQLARFADRHPAVALIRAARRSRDVLREGLADGRFVGADGRVHPEYFQLGTHTGRQTSRRPNVLGLGRVFRPLIVPEPGRGIGEVDLSQFEIGVAAAVYGDAALVEMFNTGDVYSAMAQAFYADRLDEADRRLDGREFKRRYRAWRDRMKACTLGIVFGLTPHGLARQLGINATRGAEMLGRFMAMFPTLQLGARRGQPPSGACVRAIPKLRDEFGAEATPPGRRRDPAHDQERNWMMNHPVQGTAAALFKMAGNRLRPLYRRHDAWLILAVHDAYVYEAPLEPPGGGRHRLDRGGSCARPIEEFFPMLRPRDAAQRLGVLRLPGTKDGHSDSIDRWIEDPTYSL